MQPLKIAVGINCSCWQLSSVLASDGFHLLGMQGLLHVSDMSWDHVHVPEDIVQPGDEIQCKIKAIDKARQRIYFSLKMMEVGPSGTEVAIVGLQF